METLTNRVYAPAASGFAGDIALLGSDLCNPAATQRKICYDSVGNMTRDKHSINAGVMVYDAENRLVSHSTESGYPPTLFSYDGNGRRVNMQSGEYSTTFVYGLGGELMYETGKSVLKHYGYRSGQLLVTVSSVTRFPDVRWLVADHLGTPRIVLDQNGTKTRHDYLPFGEEIGSSVGGRSSGYGYSTPQSDGVRKQFTGYERDNETGLDFAQARYYSSNHGRFTSPDDFQNDTEPDDPQSWNLYVYVRNKPLIAIDPTGMMGDYFSKNGTYLGNDGIDDKKVWFATLAKSEGGKNYIYTDSKRKTTIEAVLRAQDAAVVLTPGNPNEAIQGFVNSVADNAEAKGRTVRMAATVAGTAGVCVGTAGAGCAGAVRLGTAIIQSEMEAAQTAATDVHGNSLSSPRPTWDYELYDNDGNFLKNGITSQEKPENRYTREYMKDKDMPNKKLHPNRRAARDVERRKNTVNPGPLNRRR